MSSLANKKLEALHKQLLKQSKTPATSKTTQSKYNKPRSKNIQKILKGSKANNKSKKPTNKEQEIQNQQQIDDQVVNANEQANEEQSQELENTQQLNDSIELPQEQQIQQPSPINKSNSNQQKEISNNKQGNPQQIFQSGMLSQISQNQSSTFRQSKLHKDPPMLYSPQSPFPKPKYYHLTTFKYPAAEQLSLVISSATAQSNRDFVQENKFRATQNVPKNIKINMSLNQQINQISKDEKQQNLNSYIELLRKVELIKFMANDTFGETKNQVLQQKNKTLEQILVDVQVDNVQIDDPQEQIIYDQMTQKYGEEYYQLLKKMFNMFAIKKNHNISLNQRQIQKLIQYFQLPQKIQYLNSHKLELFVHSQIKQKGGISFLDFVEILYSICKLSQSSKQFEEQFSLLNPDQKFKLFLDDYIKPSFKQINMKLYEFNIEKIKIFFEPYNPLQNPTVSLFYEMDNLLKHIFSLYETQNLKIDSQSYITITNFIRFCKDFDIVPHVCRFQQAIKFFRAFQKGNLEIIYFSGFIMLFCCIAHIGFMGQEYEDNYKGFFKKIQKLFEIIIYANSNVAESLMINNLNKFKN